MGPGGPIGGALDDVVRAFERSSEEAHTKDRRHPIYRIVSGQNAAHDQVADPTRFLISVAGGMPPDVIWFDRFAVAEWASRNAFEPLDKYIADDLKNNVPDPVRPEDYYQNVWAEATYKGNTYAVPNGVDDRVLFFNKDAMRRGGLSDPKTGEVPPPKTWEQTRDYNKRLSRKDNLGNLQTLGFAPNYGNSWLYMFGWMAGGKFMSDDGRTCTLNDPPIVRALEYMKSVYDDVGGYQAVTAFQSGFQGGTLDPFIQGKVIMRIDGIPYIRVLAQFAADLDFGVAPAPLPADRLAAGAPPVSWSGGWSYAIPVNAHHKQGAWEFIRFALSEKGARTFSASEYEAAQSMGFPYIPEFHPRKKLNEELVKKYVFDNPRFSAKIKDGVRVGLDLLPHARFRPVTPVGQLLWNQQVSAMEEGLYGRKSPKEALDYATRVVQRDLDRVLQPPTGPLFNVNWFFAGYALFVILAFVLVYLWDTHTGFRRGLAQLFGMRRQIGEGDVVEGSRGGYFRKQWLGGFLCASPWILGFVIFGGGPLLYSIIMSFCDYDVLSPARFIGLKNFNVLFLEDELAPKAFWNTVYMLIGIPIGITAGLGVALLLNLKLRAMTGFRTMFYLPTVVPAVATYMLWIWIFNPVGGPLNSLLGLFGIQGRNWLGDEWLSKPSLIFMGLWGVGGGMVIWLAGLRNISEQLYEAASLDGANVWQQFRHITIPQLSPYIFFNLIMGLIGGFQRFDEAFVMTQGGPVNSTLFYVYHLFNNAFRYGHMGYASALAWALFVVILFFTIIQMRLANKWVYYEHD